MIEFRDVSKSYAKGRVKAVDGLDLTVNAGEIFGFLGPNGAGKTTTIKLIVGLLRPDSGTIIVNGVDNQKDPFRMQGPDDVRPRSARRLRALDGDGVPEFHRRRLRRGRGAEARSHLPMGGDLEIAANLANPIQSYSHGMRQKIVLMAAFLPEPEVIVLDEPLVGLDPRAAHELMKTMMREHCRRGGTLFFSTHIMEVAEKLCDRIGIIHRGRLVADGTMEELRSRNGTRAVLREYFPGVDGDMSRLGASSASPCGSTSGFRYSGRKPF